MRRDRTPVRFRAVDFGETWEKTIGVFWPKHGLPADSLSPMNSRWVWFVFEIWISSGWTQLEHGQPLDWEIQKWSQLGDSEMGPHPIGWWLNNIHYPHLKKHQFHQDLAAHLWQLNPWFHRCNFAAASALFFARGTLSHLFNGVSSLCRWPCHVTCHPTFETYGLFDHR